MFYNAYILPIMDYCYHIWGKENKACINQIHKIQLRICKIMLDLPMRSTSKSIYEDLQIMSFDNRCMYHVAVLVFKTLNNMAPSYMTELLKLSCNTAYNLRSKTNKDIVLFSTPRTNYYKDTFEYYGMTTWNSIPISIRNLEKIDSFKSNYKQFLLQKQFNS